MTPNVEQDSEALRMIREVRGLLQETKSDAGIELIRDLANRGIDELVRAFRDDQARQAARPPLSSTQDLEAKIRNLRDLADLAKRLYPEHPTLEGARLVRKQLEEDPA